MKIAFFSDVLMPPVGGIEQYIVDVSKALAKRGNEVKVFAPEPLSEKSQNSNNKSQINIKSQISNFKKEFEEPNLEFKFISGLPARALWENLRLSFPINLYFQFHKWQPGVIHFHTLGPMADAAIILSKLLKTHNFEKKSSFRRPLLVGTFHSYLMEPEYLKRFNLSKNLTKSVSEVLWGLSRLIYDQADLIITPSQWVAEDLKAHRFTKPVKVVHNGVDLGEFAARAGQKSIVALINRYHLSGKTLLYVGRLSEEKGLDVLLRALALLTHQESGSRITLRDDDNGVKLLFVGDGPAQKELEKLAKDLGINDRVIFLGRINHEDLGGSGIYEASQIFINPSTSETFSLVTIEAMAKGLPIIGAHARALIELIKENGFLVAPNDKNELSEKIDKLLSNENERVRMGENSRKISVDYSLEKVADNLENMYELI